ncbi:hypothetical protein FJT64_015861 [Amphibalanus amphitrite]|uniref:Larval cuticle protein 16/17 n=1 Tax=Amphibalanus amphitrite TaxID=1232801 RepID=A0A6A4XC84_AMPAM|nr:cuticle protein AMP1B-like isoform X2 [Amphibalanus amphitrite]KAF0313614.1 hypothetical protein FJT64_015861 [Amphibalanus amphitrite]
MKLIVLSCVLACAVALPQQLLSPKELRDIDRAAVITSFTNENLADGSNENAFTADNGLERRERIVLKQVEIINSDGQTEYRTVPTYQGSFKYQQEDGQVIERTYVTDEYGTLQIDGPDLPLPVPDPHPQ